MSRSDFAKCEKPDELLQLAWNAGFDKKALIREGSDAARRLLTGDASRDSVFNPFWPVPHPLEVVDCWSQNAGAPTAFDEWLRACGSAVLPGCVVGVVVVHFAVSPPGVGWDITPTEAGIVLLSIVVHIVVFKLLIGALLRRRVARLDEERALGIVLEQLRRGMVKNPSHVPRAVGSIYTRVLLLEGE